MEKGYGIWWDILCTLAERRESADPSNNAEPWFDNDSQNTDPENYLAGSKNATADKKGKCKPECKPKRKKRNHWTEFTNFNKIVYW